MVFGFGKGTIEVKLDKHAYMPGETIKGTATLKLKKPVTARKVEVIFYGTKTVRSARIGPSSRGIRVGSDSSTQTVYEFPLQLDGEKEYYQQEYPFEIKIPSNVLSQSQGPGGAATGALKAAQILSGMIPTGEKTSWFVKARLDVPRGLDVSKQVQITLG